jgi:hypothetical protein
MLSLVVTSELHRTSVFAMESAACPILFFGMISGIAAHHRYGLIDGRESFAQEICFAAYLEIIKHLAL